LSARLALAALGMLALAACSGTQLQTTSADIAAGIQAACADVAAAAKLNPSSPVVPWAVGACGTATAVAALVQNSATIQWLGQIQAQLAQPPAAAAASA